MQGFALAILYRYCSATVVPNKDQTNPDRAAAGPMPKVMQDLKGFAGRGPLLLEVQQEDRRKMLVLLCIPKLGNRLLRAARRNPGIVSGRMRFGF